jgi:succinate dehydrogenase / fumarate reductase cytochrome b subunit
MMRSILKKALMALTGVGLIGFLVAHLAGNLKIFAGPAGFNQYADFLEGQGPLLIVAEMGLLAIFVAHIALAIRVSIENAAARPVDYKARKTAGESTLASRTMMISGVIIVVFVVLHVWHFKFGDKRDPATHATALWELVVKSFSDPIFAAWYVIAMIILGLHLSHGTSSMLQTLGVIKPDWRTKSRTVGAIIGWAIALGFMSMPVYVFLAKPKAPPLAPIANHAALETAPEAKK